MTRTSSSVSWRSSTSLTPRVFLDLRQRMAVEVVLDTVSALERFERAVHDHVERVTFVVELLQRELGLHLVDGTVAGCERATVLVDERRGIQLPHDRRDVGHE